MAVDDSIPYSD